MRASPALTVTPNPRPSLLGRVYNVIYMIAQIINGFGNGGIAAGLGGTNLGVAGLGGFTATCNSLAQAEAGKGESEVVQYTGWKKAWYNRFFWWVDPLIASIYGLGCGATTAASAFLVFSAINAVMGGIPSIIFVGVVIASIALVACLNDKNLRKTKTAFFLKTLPICLTVLAASIVPAIVLITAPGGAALLPIIITVYSFFLCITIGLSSTLVNFSMTHTCITGLILAEDKPTPKVHHAKTRYTAKVIIGIGSLMSSVAIGGLTYISIMAIPAAFGAAAPFLPLCIVAIFVSVVTAAAMMPLLYTSCNALIENLPKRVMEYLEKHDYVFVSSKDRKDTSWNRFCFYTVGIFKSLWVFNFNFRSKGINENKTKIYLYENTRKNKIYFYLRAVVITLIAPSIIGIGSVMTMLQAGSYLGQAIVDLIKFINIGGEEHASSISTAILATGLVSDGLFALEWGIKFAFILANYVLPLSENKEFHDMNEACAANEASAAKDFYAIKALQKHTKDQRLTKNDLAYRSTVLSQTVPLPLVAPPQPLRNALSSTADRPITRLGAGAGAEETLEAAATGGAGFLPSDPALSSTEPPFQAAEYARELTLDTAAAAPTTNPVEQGRATRQRAPSVSINIDRSSLRFQKPEGNLPEARRRAPSPSVRMSRNRHSLLSRRASGIRVLMPPSPSASGRVRVLSSRGNPLPGAVAEEGSAVRLSVHG